MATITISQDWLDKIKSIAAFPSASMLLLDDDQIKSFCISRALQDYFTKFPLKAEYQTSTNAESTYDFPDAYTIGVLDCRVVDMGMVGGTGSSFWDILQYNTLSGNTINYFLVSRPGSITNGYMERPRFQISCRSANPGTVSNIAHAVHSLFNNYQGSSTLGFDCQGSHYDSSNLIIENEGSNVKYHVAVDIFLSYFNN
jgi:hypothetical protein